jgi:F-type H+-transporting ATPase subunit delta
MKDIITARIYAHALLEMAVEQKENLVEELVALTETVNNSNQLENVLFLDVFTTDEKRAVFNDIAQKSGFSPLLTTSVNFLIEERRIGLLPLITKEAIVMDDHRRGFLRGTIEGAEANIDPQVVEQMKAFIKTKLGREPNLQYVQSMNISAGYRLTVDDLQLDASLDNQLEQFKKSVIRE